MAARYRRPATDSSKKESPASPTPSSAAANDVKELKTGIEEKRKEDEQKTGFSVLDVLRVLGGVALLSCGMSYLSMNGESMTWGYNPWWTRAREWKALVQGGIYLTDDQLLAYDGTDTTKPIYLALNGTIYDVSANPKTYGPGGSYHFFAGRDAARGFLTGCFQEDLTPDLRGVEMMYMPVDPPLDEETEPSQAKSFDPATGKETDVADPHLADEHKKARGRDKRRKELSKGELKNRHAQELRAARKQVKEGLEHWHEMFRGDKGKAYFKVGEVVREKGWLEKLPRRELCKEAEKGRPKRKYDD
ncbi:hypothetical protein EJ04DRAFT_542923 [Polyplosphaeria fusca]|uniref:Cytochrome b5 heme-binding domain-containing protein n=1 Tax=Polyplosphaeria fusca TaxID=682080 RepID=A0A9P4QXV8_9PLEO|nr:hypothetical protein EJ04DRAFT_542923 [Polyplosphaeria fusca]